MIELTKWWESVRCSFDNDWLILGKGPTLADYDSTQARYHTFGLNHVVQQYHVDVAHAIDAEVIADCESFLEDKCKYLLMPYCPNVCGFSGERPLDSYFDIFPVLSRLSESGRLVWYHLENGVGNRKHPNIESPIVTVKFFSAEAALSILGILGVRRIRSYGIDGGAGYARSFQTLEKKTLLANGRVSFDCQFAELDRIARCFAMDYKPMTEPMRVFVGTDDSQMVAAKVLEHSIKKCSSRPVSVTHMLNLDFPQLTNPKIKPGTGFSFARFMIPQLMNYQGRAMYCDADMQVFADIAELWEIPFGDQTVLCTRQDYTPDCWKNNPAFTPGRQMSVMLLDCGRLDWKIADIINGLNTEQYSYKALLAELCIIPSEQIRDDLPSGWNCLEYYDDEKSRLVHYTNVPTQPWRNADNPLAGLWIEGFRDAVRDGAVSLKLISQAVRDGYVRSELLDEAIKLSTECGATPDDPLSAARDQLWAAIHKLGQKDAEVRSLRIRIAQLESGRAVSVRRSVGRILRAFHLR
jgi:hypothetical protein